MLTLIQFYIRGEGLVLEQIVYQNFKLLHGELDRAEN